MNSYKRFATAAVPLAIGLAVLGAAASGQAQPGPAPDATTQGPLHCEIQKIVDRGSLSLAAVVHADVVVSGTYAFHVTSGGSGGSSNIQQGGPFAADAKAPTTLGTVMLSPGAKYTATLSVTANGATVACTDPAAAPI